MGGNRKEQRLSRYSYSENGAYFITICCENMSCLLGRIYADSVDIRPTVGGGVPDAPFPGLRMELTECGRLVDNKIKEMNEQYKGVCVDNYIIMPNHIHLLLSIEPTEGASRTPPPTVVNSRNNQRSNETVPQFVSYLKRSTNKESGLRIWQRGYHDHVIRDSNDYQIRWKYISDNPARWAEDEYYV